MLKVRTLAIGSIAAVAVAAFAAVPAGAAGLSANGSIGQAYVLGGQPDQKVSLLNARGKAIQSGTTDRFGSYIFLGVSAPARRPERQSDCYSGCPFFRIGLGRGYRGGAESPGHAIPLFLGSLRNRKL